MDNIDFEQYTSQILRFTSGLNEIKVHLEHHRKETATKCHSLESISRKLQEEAKQLSTDINKLETKIDGQLDRSITPKSNNAEEFKRRKLVLNGQQKKILLVVLKKYISIISTNHMKKVLTCSLNEATENSITMGSSAKDTRDTYKIYGLLLSGCNLKKTGTPRLPSTRDIQRHRKVPDSNDLRSINKDHIEKAIILTRNMLTLLPPLLVCQPFKYDENVHDTNRLTWHEDSRKKPIHYQTYYPLIYYRPVLVYGNQLHVAVKGLVGNSKTEIDSEQLLFTNEDPLQLPQSGQSKPLEKQDHLHKSQYKAVTPTVDMQGKQSRDKSQTDQLVEPVALNNQGYNSEINNYPPATNEASKWNLYNPSQVSPYYFFGVLSYDQNGQYCWLCNNSHPGTIQEIYMFPDHIIHKRCFRCHEAGCTSSGDTTVIYFCRQLYCQEHRYCMKCPNINCKNYLNHGHCSHCNLKWFDWPLE